MANDKKYYWLKLKDDFFRDKKMKKLRNIAGGDTYTIIYLKMQLLSLKNSGVLIFENVEDTFEEEIALEIDEKVEDVKVCLLYLEKTGLLECKDNEYVLPQTIDCIGSETAVAERVRRSRERKKQIEALHCNSSETNCNTEIDIEKDIDIDIDIERREEKEIEKKEEKRKATKVATVYYPEDERLDETFKDFLEMRKKKRVPNTDRAITLAINKINDLAKRFDGTIDNEKAIKIIEQSILSGWTSIYPLKEYKDNKTANTIDWDSV